MLYINGNAFVHFVGMQFDHKLRVLDVQRTQIPILSFNGPPLPDTVVEINFYPSVIATWDDFHVPRDLQQLTLTAGNTPPVTSLPLDSVFINTAF